MNDEVKDRSGPRRLEGQVAVVTGSSSGHGRAIALELADEGARIMCSDIRKTTLVDALGDDDPSVDTDDLIVGRGGEAAYTACDVSIEESVEALAAATLERFGRIDVWVNNAGIASAGLLTDTPAAELQRLLSVNVSGTWLGARAAARAMRNQPLRGRARGRIVNVGSIAGELGQSEMSAYAASKGAVHAMTRSLAVELGPDYIAVNAVAPGYFPQTALNKELRDRNLVDAVLALHPWPEFAPTRDVGRAVAFLASEDSAWTTGSILPVDGGILAR